MMNAEILSIGVSSRGVGNMTLDNRSLPTLDEVRFRRNKRRFERWEELANGDWVYRRWVVIGEVPLSESLEFRSRYDGYFAEKVEL